MNSLTSKMSNMAKTIFMGTSTESKQLSDAIILSSAIKGQLGGEWTPKSSVLAGCCKDNTADKNIFQESSGSPIEVM